jgi:uncharacterized protein
MSVVALFAKIIEETDMWYSEFHGTSHWMRVRDNAIYLANKTNGDAQVAEYFSVLHDCMRENECDDPEHGPRAAKYAEEHRGLIDLTNRQFLLLQRACSGHTFAKPDNRAGTDATLAACWDGDRLDIGRVGTSPKAEYLFSDLSRSLVAHHSSQRG